MKFKIFIIFSLFLPITSFTQNRDINDILNQTLTYRGLTREDITIPIEFFTAAEKSPTNDAKLMLPLVKDMMVNPLLSITWLDSVSEYKEYELSTLINSLFNNINYNFPQNNKRFRFSSKVNDILDLMEEHSENSEDRKAELMKIYSPDEISFLDKKLLSILEESDDDDGSNTDIFKFNQSRDSSIAVSKRVMELLCKLDRNKIAGSSSEDFYFCYELYKYLKENGEQLNKYYDTFRNPNKFGVEINNNGHRIIIGGKEKNTYSGDFDFIIDLGGDDVYKIDNGKDKSAGFQCIIDLSGNDNYASSSEFALAGGLFSSSFIFDKEGDDIYESRGSGNLGASIGGLGLLFDEKGNDTYKGLTFSIGAGCFGAGLLFDREGNDFYIANSYSQGFGMTEGIGTIVDIKGNDSYLIDSRSLDIGRYNDHYVSMCQGYGLGLRPFYAGGIGLIIEGEGNDIYNTDIFGQGGAYWYSLGAIVDKSGHDKYNGYQYSQGAGIHLAVGLLKDYDGWDFYQSNGVSQGCGHDFGYGMLWDVKGNDNYSAYSLSQGAGNADGIGILIDESGVDGYLNKYPSNTRGYGNPRREYGSIGVFLDASGEDYYSQPGFDSTFINSSWWGTFNDFYYTDLPSQISGDNFKVQVDTVINTSKGSQIIPNYSTADYFMMAKTIEPRFSYWMDYGFRKLIEDSLNTAQYVLTKLGTSDHRETQVMRVLGQKIQKPVADALNQRLSEYIAGRVTMTQPEVSFACYIFGETKSDQGKDILLQLTYDENYRVRSSAINAMGKIKYDTTDTEFINKAVSRFSTLANENSEKKLYNKDIAFALGNYKTPESFKTLLQMLYNSYYGARFVAAENIKAFPQLSMMTLTDSRFPDIPQGEIPLIAFIQSLTAIDDGNFKTFISFIKMMPEYNSDGVKLNLLGIMRQRNRKSLADYSDWYNSEIKELESQVNLKIR